MAGGDPVAGEMTGVIPRHNPSEETGVPSNVRIPTRDPNISLDGWLFEPTTEPPHPLIVISHGLSGLKDMGLEPYAEVFAAAGLASLVYDHRNFGGSDGLPRREIDPFVQLHDMRDAVSFGQSLPNVDPARVAVWGTSYSGGHALMMRAIDRRLAAVVSQVPMVSGSTVVHNSVPADKFDRWLARVAEERQARARGESPKYAPVAAPGSESDVQWIQRWAPGTDYVNEVTLLSYEMMLEYEPQLFVSRTSPTPLLMIIAEQDTLTSLDLSLEVYKSASEPKELLQLPCGHYDPYNSALEVASGTARDFFVRHLLPS